MQRVSERLFQCLPEINGLSENIDELPIGWQFNYIGLFNSQRVISSDSKRGIIQKKVRQVWQNAGLTALFKKMETADKDIKDFEESDTFAKKMEVIAAKNFIRRMQAHLKDLQTIA